MADLLAIISRGSADPPTSDQLDDLTKAYESVRGPARESETVSGGRVQARTLQRVPGTTGIARAHEGWTAWAGNRPRSEASMGLPLEQLDGQFALVRPGAGGSVQVAADPLGMKPFFTAESGGAVYVSTSALTLARHLRARPSRIGIESFLRSGVQFGRQTQWEGIERLRAAECREYGPDGERRRAAYWQPATEPGAADLSLAEAAELCIERATEAIAERYREERPWIDLTGGYDSRLLTLLARGAGVEFMTNTFGEERSTDVQIAERVASQAEWPWTRLHLPSDWQEQIPAYVAEALAWGDGNLDALQLAGVTLGHRQKAEVETMLLNAHGAEEYRDYPWAHELLRAGRSTNVDYGRLLDWRVLLAIDLSPLRDDPTARVGEAIRAELEDMARPFSSYPNTVQNGILYAYKSSGHSGAYQSAAGAWIDVEMPFYLRDIFVSALSVAPRHQRFHRVMREMMHQLDPAIAALPTETGGPAEPLRPWNAHRFAPYAWHRGRRFANRIGGRLPRSRRSGEPSKAQSAQGALIGRLRKTGRLDPLAMRSGALYESAKLAELLEHAVADPGAVDWRLIGRILTVELALEAADAGLADV